MTGSPRLGTEVVDEHFGKFPRVTERCPMSGFGQHHNSAVWHLPGKELHTLAVVCGSAFTKNRADRLIKLHRIPCRALPQIREFSHECGALATAVVPGAFWKRLPTRVTDQSTHERFCGLFRCPPRRHGIGAGGRTGPPGVPGQRGFIDRDGHNLLRSRLGGGESHIAPVTMAEDAGLSLTDQRPQIF